MQRDILPPVAPLPNDLRIVVGQFDIAAMLPDRFDRRFS
jgi:hypothetical protein